MAKRSRLIELYQPGRNADIEPLPYLRIFHFRLHIDFAYRCFTRVATGKFVTPGHQLFLVLPRRSAVRVFSPAPLVILAFLLHVHDGWPALRYSKCIHVNRAAESNRRRISDFHAAIKKPADGVHQRVLVWLEAL